MNPYAHERPTISLVNGGQFDETSTMPLPWLWEPYLAFGAVSILDGDPGVAKSLLAVDIAARIGIGEPMPDGSPPARNPFNGRTTVFTLFVNAEDSVRHTQVPRLLAAGGQPRLAMFVAGIGEGGEGRSASFQLPRDANFLVALLSEQFHLRGSFVVLDPFVALFPGLPASDAAVRAAIDPIVRLAADSRCCILLIRHLNKLGGGRSLYRGGGSIGILGACRTGLLVGSHPDDPERRVLSMTKTNIGPMAPSLGFRVVVRPERMGPYILAPGEKDPATGEVLKDFAAVERRIPPGPAIQWDGPTPITADDLVAAKRDQGAHSTRAAEWLRDLLANGPVAALEIEARALHDGIGFRTLQFAKQRMGVESRRVTHEGQSFWEWALPALNAHQPKPEWSTTAEPLPPLDVRGMLFPEPANRNAS